MPVVKCHSHVILACFSLPSLKCVDRLCGDGKMVNGKCTTWQRHHNLYNVYIFSKCGLLYRHRPSGWVLLGWLGWLAIFMRIPDHFTFLHIFRPLPTSYWYTQIWCILMNIWIPNVLRFSRKHLAFSVHDDDDDWRWPFGVLSIFGERVCMFFSGESGDFSRYILRALQKECCVHGGRACACIAAICLPAIIHTFHTRKKKEEHARLHTITHIQIAGSLCGVRVCKHFSGIIALMRKPSSSRLGVHMSSILCACVYLLLFSLIARPLTVKVFCVCVCVNVRLLCMFEKDGDYSQRSLHMEHFNICVYWW